MYLFVPYKYWNALGWLMHVSCLSVDILIFYKEPFGPVGTMAAQVFGFIPYYVITGKFDKSIGHTSNVNTIRPRGTRPHGTRTSLGHDFKKGSKILAGHDFGT